MNRADSPLRLFIAENGEGRRAVRAPDGLGAGMWSTLMDTGEPRLTFAREE